MKIRYGLITLIAVATVTLAEQSNDFNADELDVLQLYGDEDFISIATGVVQPIAKAPAVASVITASEIKSMGNAQQKLTFKQTTRELNQSVERHYQLAPAIKPNLWLEQRSKFFNNSKP